ncbi:N-acetylneuraminate synthase family protein [bacterium]|nr:N-acetylneuraminate synthase family protein [bacterium]MBU1024753.1 N-acetylneuraminate synthase family protein [bacterium]
MPDRVQIGNRWIGKNEPTFVIAEAGINHQGDLKIAIKLVDIAAFAGADCVKFQKRNIKSLLTKEGFDKPYENSNSFGKTYGEHRLALELSEEDFKQLKEYAESKGLIFLASPWDVESADFLDSIGMVAFKMASADLGNLPFLEHVAKKGKPMIVSTGMAYLDEVERAYNLIKEHNDEIIILQCTSTYPSEFHDINLNILKTYQEKFDCPIGYSGHERGIAIPVAAVAMGAQVIERHFTIDRTMKGGDHAASLEPGGLKKMIRDLRAVEQSLGSFEKKKLDSEINVALKLKKSLTSAKPIKEGTVITRDLLTAKCPGDGIPPSEIDNLIGKIANRIIETDKILYWEYFQ